MSYIGPTGSNLFENVSRQKRGRDGQGLDVGIRGLDASIDITDERLEAGVLLIVFAPAWFCATPVGALTASLCARCRSASGSRRDAWQSVRCDRRAGAGEGTRAHESRQRRNDPDALEQRLNRRIEWTTLRRRCKPCLRRRRGRRGSGGRDEAQVPHAISDWRRRPSFVVESDRRSLGMIGQPPPHMWLRHAVEGTVARDPHT